MEYFFIYSAGGGAGDWNGLKRVWRNRMSPILKKRILLKFGDVYYNHASSSNLIKSKLWRNVTNMRTWISENVNDEYVQNHSIILLDSGTSKIVNYIVTNHENFTVEQVIEKFRELIQEKNIMKKYVDIILSSNIQEAVTFDVPNPFKIRTQSQNTRTNVFDKTDSHILIQTSAELANETYHLLRNDQKRILTTINGQWSDKELDFFFSLLDYRPNKLAIGGLTRSYGEILNITRRLNRKLVFENYEKIHFLGCGGLKIASRIKEAIGNSDAYSVDNSTSWNRAIDGNTSGTAHSGYFDYTSKIMIRIKPSTRDKILSLHKNSENPFFSLGQMREIIDNILAHQSNNSSKKTYEARASLAIHNHDVFRVNSN